MARNYTYDISISSWRANVPWDPYTEQLAKRNGRGINYIELEFHEHVYPIRVSIYEVYRPGNIIKISAQDSQSKWFPLWEGSVEIRSSRSRLFSPPLQSCNFKTNRLRFEFFKHSYVNYTKLDAVMLIGTSELILSRNPAESLTDLLNRINYSRCVHNLCRNSAEDLTVLIKSIYLMYSRSVLNLTEDYEIAHLDIIRLQNNFPKHCIIYKSDVEKIFHKVDSWYKKVSIPFWKVYYIPDVREILSIAQRYLHRLLNYYYAKDAKFIQREGAKDESKELSPFSTLPDKVILEILKHLDLVTLCRMNQVNRRFYDLTLDPRLYTCLNMRNIPCPTYIQNILDESKELSPFSTLPDEVILEILKHLDLETLCRMKQVNRRFYNLTLDPRFYTRLNMRNIPCPTYIQNILDESKELSPISTLPDEVILEILKHLDLETLCRMNQVNRRFYNLTLDPLLYTRLNMRNILCPTDIQNIFCYFTPRCKYLQQLDVTLCDLSFPATFLQFLENCGRYLTHLRLRKCVGVDGNIALKISEVCKNLKVLDLPRYREPQDSYLKNLTNLKYLKLDSTICMGVQAFINTLRNVKWMTGDLDVHVRFGPGMNLDYVATELRRSCFYSKITNLEGNYVVSHIGFPNRKNLRKKLEIQIVDDSFNILLSSCQLLEELYLSDSYPYLTDRNLKLLAECKNLKHLHLKCVGFETPENFSIIIEQCPKLQKFCLVGSNVRPNLIYKWKESHPQVLQTVECWR
ncbi:uncharacterized protein [Temnothorax nylanderi]|uniref:uncharacterized protein n=1 Tax=Temnothorax nylanderi TaxID=102681 RepID=UPI003A8911E4